MAEWRQVNFKKSLYLFLCSLMGVILFLLIHRAASFIILSCLSLSGGMVSQSSYLLYVGLDYFTLILVLMFGSWYGLWLGMHWYQKVYEEGSYKGLAERLMGRPKINLQPKKEIEADIKLAEKTLQEGIEKLEEVSKIIPESLAIGNLNSLIPVKKRAAKKRTVKKTKKSV